MRWSVFFFGVAMASVIGSAAVAEESAQQGYSIQFVGEDGKPIQDATYYLFYGSKRGTNPQETGRGRPLEPDGRINLHAALAGFTLGVSSESHFYKAFWKSTGDTLKPYRATPTVQEIKLLPGDNIIRLEQSGRVSFNFATIDAKAGDSFVLSAYHKSADGRYIEVSDFGVSFRVQAVFDADGLAPGIYKFELKKNSGADAIYWALSDVAVRKARVTKLTDLHAQSTFAAFKKTADQKMIDVVNLWKAEKSLAAVQAIVAGIEADDEYTRGLARDALPELGPSAMPGLLRIANSSDVHFRRYAQQQLDRLDGEHVITAAALAEAATDKNPKVREEAVSRLGRIVPPAKEAVDVLIRALADESDVVRLYAAYALAGLGPDAQAAVPSLSKGLEDSDPAVRSAMADALAKIKPK